MIEHEIRTPADRLAYGPLLTKKKAAELGVRWTGAVSDSLGADQPYKPSLFQGMWDDDEQEEQEKGEGEELTPAALFKRLLDIFCRLFTH
jgi:hypothetical protein